MASSAPASATQRAVLVIPHHPPNSINATSSKHWSTQRRYSRDWQMHALIAWGNGGRPEFIHPHITIRLYARGDRIIRDPDNRVASCKALIDGLKGRAFSDDSAAVLASLTVEAFVCNKNPRVEIELVEALA